MFNQQYDIATHPHRSPRLRGSKDGAQHKKNIIIIIIIIIIMIMIIIYHNIII